jgi:hypothetical protein
LFGRQFLQGDEGVFDQAPGNHLMSAEMAALVAGQRQRIHSPLDTLRLFVSQGENGV